MRITIKKAIELRNFTANFKGHKSLFGLKCIGMNKQLNEKLESFDNEFYEKKVEFALVGKNHEVLMSEDGKRFLNNKEGQLKLQSWLNDEMKKEIEIEPMITDKYSLIENNLDAIDLCNGLLINVNLDDLD